ncbi:hypothetical protein D3C84_779970 [compost metagenome]
MVEARQRHGHDGRGVTLRQDDVRFFGEQDLVQLQQQAGRERCQCLVRLHDVEVEIRRDAEEVQDLIQHVPVLRGRKDFNVRPWLLLERQNHRRHLDRFRACADRADNFDFHNSTSSFDHCTTASGFLSACSPSGADADSNISWRVVLKRCGNPLIFGVLPQRLSFL